MASLDSEDMIPLTQLDLASLRRVLIWLGLFWISTAVLAACAYWQLH